MKIFQRRTDFGKLFRVSMLQYRHSLSNASCTSYPGSRRLPIPTIPFPRPFSGPGDFFFAKPPEGTPKRAPSGRSCCFSVYALRALQLLFYLPQGRLADIQRLIDILLCVGHSDVPVVVRMEQHAALRRFRIEGAPCLFHFAARLNTGAPEKPVGEIHFALS